MIPELLRILNASFRIEKKEGDETVVVAEIDGETGAAMFGKGAHLFKEDGSLSLANENIIWNLIYGLLLRGKFESNREGNKIIIDPETRSIQMVGENGYVYASMSFQTEGRQDGAQIVFRGYNEWVFKIMNTSQPSTILVFLIYSEN